MKPNNPQDKVSKKIHARIMHWTKSWSDARNALTAKQKEAIVLRQIMQMIPFGIGAAISEGYFGTIDMHRANKIQQTIQFLSDQVALLGSECTSAIQPNYFESEQFSALFEDTWRKILAEAQSEKMHALRNALLSIIICKPNFSFSKKKFFITSFDRIAEEHIQILQIFNRRFRCQVDAFQTQEIWRIMKIDLEADRDYVYAALDVLANLRYIEHRSVPQVKDGRINYPLQLFRLTEMGSEYLHFIRAGEVKT